MFILQRYKHYILNQKKSEKKFHGIAKKNERAGERRSPAQYYEEKVLLTLSRDSRR